MKKSAVRRREILRCAGDAEHAAAVGCLPRVTFQREKERRVVEKFCVVDQDGAASNSFNKIVELCRRCDYFCAWNCRAERRSPRGNDGDWQTLFGELPAQENEGIASTGRGWSGDEQSRQAFTDIKRDAGCFVSTHADDDSAGSGGYCCLEGLEVHPFRHWRHPPGQDSAAGRIQCAHLLAQSRSERSDVGRLSGVR